MPAWDDINKVLPEKEENALTYVEISNLMDYGERVIRRTLAKETRLGRINCNTVKKPTITKSGEKKLFPTKVYWRKTSYE